MVLFDYQSGELIDAKLINEESCVLDFYNELKNAYSDVSWWTDDTIDNDGIINEVPQSKLTIIDLIKNLKVGNLAEELNKMMALKDQEIATLTQKLAESETANLNEMKDAIEALKKQNNELLQENQKIKDHYEDARQFVMNYREAEMKLMIDLMVNSKKYTNEELAPLEYKELKDKFETAQRFLDLGDVKVIPTQPVICVHFLLIPLVLGFRKKWFADR